MMEEEGAYSPKNKKEIFSNRLNIKKKIKDREIEAVTPRCVVWGKNRDLVSDP